MMKKALLEIKKIELEDIITTSGDDTIISGGDNEGNKGDEGGWASYSLLD